MKDNTPAVLAQPEFAAMSKLVLDTLTSVNSKRVYAVALDDFFAWFTLAPNRNFTKATVSEYRQWLIERHLAPQTINQRLCAVRSLARELADNNIGPHPDVLRGIERIKGVKNAGTRLGNWLSEEDAARLLDAPNTTTLTGLRDAALLSCLLGCGLRREEAAKLTEGHFRLIENRWVIANLLGKGGRLRNVVVPDWCKHDVDAYLVALRQTESFRILTTSYIDMQPTTPLSELALFVSIKQSGQVATIGITPQTVYNIVLRYAKQCDIEKLAPHDVRRSYAKLSVKGGADIRVLQRSLGHSSLTTTELYVGTEDNFTSGPGDKVFSGTRERKVKCTD